MQISSHSANCYKARNLDRSTDEVSRMIQGMRKRGVAVQVLEQRGAETVFCIN